MLEKDKKSRKFWTPKSKRKASSSEAKIFHISCVKEKGKFGFSLNSGWPVIIDKVFEDTPAWESGLFIGDRIMAVNGFLVDKSSSLQVANMIQKISGHLDLCIERQDRTDVKDKLATFKSYLILDGDLEEQVRASSPNCRQSMSMSDCDHISYERKDSGTESGFLEIEAEFDDDVDRVLPDSFELLPPLEQRRQRAIFDLVSDENDFLGNFTYAVEDISVVTEKLFMERNLEKEFRKLESKILKLQNIFLDVSGELHDKRVKYAQPCITEDGIKYYLDAVGAIYKWKAPDVLSTLTKIVKDDFLLASRDLITDSKEGDTYKDFFQQLNGLITYVKEYLLELQINISHALSCTPRKHKDHKPLRDILEELKKYNYSTMVETSSKKTVVSDMKTKEKSKQQKVKRRFSWDSSSFRAFAQLSRTFSFNANTLNSTSPPKASPCTRVKDGTPKGPLFQLWTLRHDDNTCTQSLPRKFTIHDFRQSEIRTLATQGKPSPSGEVKNRKWSHGPLSHGNSPHPDASMVLQKEHSLIGRKLSKATSNSDGGDKTRRPCHSDTLNDKRVSPIITVVNASVESRRGRSKSERVENSMAIVGSPVQNMKRLSRSVEDLTFRGRRRPKRHLEETCNQEGNKHLNVKNNILLLDSDDDEDSVLNKQIGMSLATFDQSSTTEDSTSSNTDTKSNSTAPENRASKSQIGKELLSSGADLEQSSGDRNSCVYDNVDGLDLCPLPDCLDFHGKSCESPAVPALFSSQSTQSTEGCNGEVPQDTAVDIVFKNQLEGENSKWVTTSSSTRIYSSNYCKDGKHLNSNSKDDKEPETDQLAGLQSDAIHISSPVLSSQKTKTLSSVSRIQQKLRERRRRHASLSDMFKTISPISGAVVERKEGMDSLTRAKSKQGSTRGDGAPDLTISSHFNQRVRDLLQYSSAGEGSSSKVSSVDDSYVRSPTRISPLTSRSTGNMAKFQLTREMARHHVHGRSVSLTPGMECSRENLSYRTQNSREKGVVEMKVKTPGSYRRHTVTSTENSALEVRRILSKKSRPSQSDIKRWSEGIDSLLSDQRGVEIFRIFLRSEFSEENVLFWLACEELKQTRTYKLPIKARKLFKTFIEIDSPYEVNIDHETRSQIEESMKTPTRTMFDTAQRRIRYLMANDSYPRFLKSFVYSELVR